MQSCDQENAEVAAVETAGMGGVGRCYNMVMIGWLPIVAFLYCIEGGCM